MIFSITLEKQYVHKRHGGLRTVYGVMPIEANSREAAIALASTWLNRMQDWPLQTNDPRIAWEEEVDHDAWEYVDFSFDLVDEDEPVDIDALLRSDVRTE